jgi:hypothetical protein
MIVPNLMIKRGLRRAGKRIQVRRQRNVAELEAKIMLTRLTLLSFAIIGSIATPAPAEFRQALAQFGQRCQTPRGTCFITAPVPLGSPCFCPTPLGNVAGKVI